MPKARDNQFNIDLDAAVDRFGGYINEVFRATTFAVAEAVSVGRVDRGLPGTPVDTGYARACWTSGLGSVGDTAAFDGSGADNPYKPRSGNVLPPSDLAAALIEMGMGQTAFITNHASYIMALEFGHSKKAPEGMVRITLADAQGLMDEIAEAVGGPA